MPHSEVTFDLPPFYCPVPGAVSPFAEAAEQHTLQWLDAVGLGLPGLRTDALKARLHILAGIGASGAVDEEIFRSSAKFLVWLFLLDDQRIESQPELEAAAEMAGQVMRAFTSPGYQVAKNDDPFVVAAYDLAEQLRARCHPTHYNRFLYGLRHFFSGALRMWAACHGETPPTEDRYLSLRLEDSSIFCAGALIEACGQQLIPDEELYAPAVQAALESAGLLLVLDNDLYSYRKELNDPKQANLVKTVRDNRRLPLEAALTEAVAVRDRILLLSLRLNNKLRPTASAPLQHLLEEIDRTTRGHIEWAMSAPPRYQHHVTPTDITWASAPSTAKTSPLPYPSISWWWDHT